MTFVPTPPSPVRYLVTLGLTPPPLPLKCHVLFEWPLSLKTKLWVETSKGEKKKKFNLQKVSVSILVLSLNLFCLWSFEYVKTQCLTSLNFGSQTGGRDPF
jgi:hypothetical protein